MNIATRTGAITVTLDVWHKDIFDFLDMRKENIDLRLQSQDLFGQIAVNDVFLEVYNQSVKSQSKEPDWLTFCPYVFKELTGIEIENTWGETFRVAYNHAVSLYESGELYNAVKVSSRALMKKILETAKESGLPYWFNKDYVNHCNPNKHRGVINSSNLCVESFSTFNAEYSHVCNLHSINLSKGIEDKDIERAVRMSVIALNQIVTLSTSPLESTRKHNDEFRIIGIGALGYHDHLVKKGLYYAKSASYAYELFEKIAYWAIDESVNEVTHIGEYPAFSGSDWESGVFFGRSVYSEDFSDTPGMNENWIRLYEDKVAKFGMANGGLLSIAPNTGTSQLVNSSASILPVYSKFFTEKNKLMVVPFAAKYLSNETFWLYQEAINLDPNVVIEVCQNAQQWVDQGISMELVLNTNHYNDAKTLRDWYLKAMIGNGNRKSKTVYYLRPIQKGKEEGCTSCAN